MSAFLGFQGNPFGVIQHQRVCQHILWLLHRSFHDLHVAGQVGSEVSFSVVPDPTAGRGADKWNAVALELLPDGTLAEERRWPGAPPPCAALSGGGGK